jgi:hypothetical protein
MKPAVELIVRRIESQKEAIPLVRGVEAARETKISGN